MGLLDRASKERIEAPRTGGGRATPAAFRLEESDIDGLVAELTLLGGAPVFPLRAYLAIAAKLPLDPFSLSVDLPGAEGILLASRGAGDGPASNFPLRDEAGAGRGVWRAGIGGLAPPEAEGEGLSRLFAAVDGAAARMRGPSDFAEASIEELLRSFGNSPELFALRVERRSVEGAAVDPSLTAEGSVIAWLSALCAALGPDSQAFASGPYLLCLSAPDMAWDRELLSMQLRSSLASSLGGLEALAALPFEAASFPRRDRNLAALVTSFAGA